MNYIAKHTEYMKNAGLILSDLPQDLQVLVRKFNAALWDWNNATEYEQRNYLTALVQTDALIAARVFGLKKVTVKVEPEKIDMEKLKELKAKMLLLNKKNNKK